MTVAGSESPPHPTLPDNKRLQTTEEADGGGGGGTGAGERTE